MQRAIHPEVITLVKPMESGTVPSIDQTRSFLERSEINLELLLSLGNSLPTEQPKKER